MNEIFEELYALWPKKGDRANTRQAFDFVYKKHQYSGPDYIKAAKLWLFKASPFQKENQSLGNWLRDEKFIPELEDIKQAHGLENALEHAQMFKDAALVVIGEWNRLKRGWWASVMDIDGWSNVVEKALRDEFFQKNWKKALVWAVNIFKYPAKDSMGMTKLIPSIAWFCNIEERTAAKLLEGHFGMPEKSTPPPKHIKEEFSPEERKDLAALVAQTKEAILDKPKPEATPGPWKVINRITTMRLCYKGAVIKEEKMPLTKADQDAMFMTLTKQANTFNNIGYEPDLNVKTGFERDT